VPEYEIVAITEPEMDDELNERQIQDIEKIITDASGVIKKRTIMGAKPLSYPINKKKSGFYTIFNCEIPVSGLSEINRKMRFHNKIMRFMITSKKLRKQKPRKTDIKTQIKARERARQAE
jgi:small subunit ribosomal protein S6